MTATRAMVLDAAARPLRAENRDAREPGPGEVLLRVRATSVNYHDYVNVMGGIPRLPYPRVPFSDVCAEIERVGEGVRRAKPGDRVCVNFFPRWTSGRPEASFMSPVYGDQVDGFLQTRAVVAAESLVRPPAHLTDQEAATLGCAGLTAWRSVAVEGGIKAGDVVVVQGTGGVSLYALAFAKMLGAVVVLTSSSDEKLERARALGADHLLNYRSDPDWDRRVQELTDGRGADLVVDVGGADTFPRAVRAVRLDGHVSIIGVLTGFAPEFPLAQVMAKNLTVRGITVGSRSQFEDMNRAIAAHGYRPVLDRAFPLEAANDALALMASQAHFGKIVIEAG